MGYLSGQYAFSRSDLPFLLDGTIPDSISSVPTGDKDSMGNLEQLNEKLPEHLKYRRPSQMTIEEKREYRSHRKDLEKETFLTLKIKVFEENYQDFEMIKDKINEEDKNESLFSNLL